MSPSCDKQMRSKRIIYKWGRRWVQESGGGKSTGYGKRERSKRGMDIGKNFATSGTMGQDLGS